MGRKSNGRKSAERDSAGRFVRGGPGGPGRPPGSPNRRTLAGRALLKALEAGDPDGKLPSAFDRMTKLLTDRDPRVRLGAERLVLSLLHGRPTLGDGDFEDGVREAPDSEGLGLRLANVLCGLVARVPGGLTEESADEPPPSA